ncbi:MAG: alpha/beta fold hydrolase [Streptosporangiaceae bacterium]|nr:alpha/beta fold hydrolase [Streptosporangiaceae bacterium]
MSAPEADAWVEDAAEDVGGLDLLLADAALGLWRRFRPDSSALRFGMALGRRPRVVAGQAAWLGIELARVLAGRSRLAPASRDRRFADPAWAGNPVLRRVLQAYLAGSGSAEALLDGAELDWRDDTRLRFVLANLIAAAAPSNNPLLNPVAWKALIDTGGVNVVRGLRALAGDLATPPRVPSMVPPGAFEVGKTLAVTPGSVVHRTEQFELIQYQPVTETVYAYPLLIVPPMINKYYITDLAPGRSMVEYLVGQGHQVFVMSWRNPDARHREWSLDRYGGAVLEGLDAVRSVAGAGRAAKVNLCALCSGGIVVSMVAAHLSVTGQLGQVASICLGVTVLDQNRAGTAAAMIDPRAAAAAKAVSQTRGYLDGRALAEVFAWLRPDDLIWNYWVNNYLRGEPPPAFDILHWNADTTRLPAALHRDFIDLGLANALTVPDAARMLGSPVDLSKIDVDAYVIAGIADHICPWQSCYRTTQLLGGATKFVLSTSGHIAAMVNPPANPKARFRTLPGAAGAAGTGAAGTGAAGAGAAGAVNPEDPRQFLAEAVEVSGSWWPDYAAWLASHGGDQVASPRQLGSEDYPPLSAAPGTYVHDR